MSTKASRKKTTKSRSPKKATKNSVASGPTEEQAIWQADASCTVTWDQVWPLSKTVPATWNHKQSIKNYPEFKKIKSWTKFLKSQVKGSTGCSKNKADKLTEEILEFLGDAVQALPRLLSQPFQEETPNAVDWSTMEEESNRQLHAIGLGSICCGWILPIIKNHMAAKHLDTCRLALLAMASSELSFHNHPLTHQWLKVELPLTLNLHFPSDIQTSELWAQIESDLADALEESLDGNGIPSAGYLSEFPDFVAIWTRCMGISLFLERPIFDPEPEIQYQWTVRQFLRLLRSDRTLLGLRSENQISEDLCLAALVASNDEEDWEFSKKLLPELVDRFPKDRKKRFSSKKNKEPLIHASDNSEWAKLGVMRADWQPKSDKILVDYSKKDVQLQIENSHQWLSGPLTTNIQFNGQAVELSDSWTEVCWDTDDYYSYLEIQNESEDGSLVLQRQFLQSLDYRFLWIGDFVKANPKKAVKEPTLDHQWTFHVGSGCTVSTEKENTEAHLHCGKHQLNVLPMCLPEWRTESARGKLATNSDGFDLSLSLPSTQLYNAVLIDLDKKRSRQPYTWRRLMVGEKLEPVSLDRAAGFRAQLDRLQFLFYRNLGEITSQTVLGQNYYCDFFAGYFTPGGTCDEIVMINGPVEDDEE